MDDEYAKYLTRPKGPKKVGKRTRKNPFKKSPVTGQRKPFKNN